LKNLLDRIQALFLIESDGEKNGFHWIIVSLIRGRLGVAAYAHEEAVEMRLILPPQRAPEFLPSLRVLLDQLDKCRDGPAHGVPRTFRSNR
jgi:hypothetical protein